MPTHIYSFILFIIHEFLSLFVTLTQTIIVNNKKNNNILSLIIANLVQIWTTSLKETLEFPLPFPYEKTYHPHGVQVGKECPLGMGGGGLFKCEIMKLKQEGDKM